MNRKNLLIAMLFTAVCSVGSAHGGADHDKPSAIQAPKGGAIKSLEQTHIEVLVKGKEIKIYLYDMNLKPKSVKDFVMSAKSEMPRTRKTEVIALVPQEFHFEGSFDAKGVHRYTLHLAVRDPKTGHDDKLKFTIEPKN